MKIKNDLKPLAKPSIPYHCSNAVQPKLEDHDFYHVAFSHLFIIHFGKKGTRQNIKVKIGNTRVKKNARMYTRYNRESSFRIRHRITKPDYHHSSTKRRYAAEGQERRNRSQFGYVKNENIEEA